MSGSQEHEKRLLGQAVKTPPFHGGNRGSIPLGVTNIMWAHSSAGRASALQAEGHRFEPCCAHHIMAQWLSWLECRPVTPEVEGSSPFWVATYTLKQTFYVCAHKAPWSSGQDTTLSRW